MSVSLFVKKSFKTWQWNRVLLESISQKYWKERDFNCKIKPEFGAIISVQEKLLETNCLGIQ